MLITLALGWIFFFFYCYCVYESSSGYGISYIALKLVHSHRLLLYKLENGSALNEKGEPSTDKSGILKFNSFWRCFAASAIKKNKSLFTFIGQFGRLIITGGRPALYITGLPVFFLYSIC